MVANWRESFQKMAKDGGSPGAINPYFVFNVLNRLIAPEDVVVADTGYMGLMPPHSAKSKRPGGNISEPPAPRLGISRIPRRTDRNQ